MTAPIVDDSALKATIGDQTSSSGLVTNTAANLLQAAMRNPQLVNSDPAAAAQLTSIAGGPTGPQQQGIPNPYGKGLSAYEPNTQVFVQQAATGGDTAAQAATGDQAIGQAAGGTAVKDAASPGAGSGVAQSATAAGDAANASYAQSLERQQQEQMASLGYAQGGVADASGKIQQFINAAIDLANRHVPYVWGGTTSSGVDCSGLIYYAAKAAGIPWTRYVAADYGKMPTIAQQDARPGDIVYWYPGEDGVGSTGHVGIYLGNGMMVVAPQSGENVQIEKVFGTPTYHRAFSDSMYGTTPTAAGGSTYNYNGQPYSGFVNQSLSPVPFQGYFVASGSKYGVPAALLAAVAHQESGFNPGVSSSAGAQGLMQFMPGTAASYGVNPWDPASAIDGAARMLSNLFRQFGSWDLALAAYNAGPGNVAKYGGIPPFAETQNYVRAVDAMFQTYSGMRRAVAQ